MIATFTHEPIESFRSSWIRFKSYQRDYPHHGFNQVQLLSTFFRGITLAYQMALASASDGNFNTRNPEEAIRLIENLASSNNTKNTDFERKKLAPALGKEQLEEVKAKLDSVHKLLKKQVSFAEDVDAVDVNSDMEEEEDVNFVSGSGFQNQRFGNQSGYRNFYGNGQKSGYNQSSQYQKPYNNNYKRNNKPYGNSYYQNQPHQTKESKTKSMLDQVLEGQQKLMVNFDGKIDVVYSELNSKFESLNTHVRKLETQVVKTAHTIKRQETFMKGKGDESLKHHVNAIMNDDFWQMIKEEKLQEVDFQVESSMSFGGLHWCRSIPSEHRPTETDPHRSTSVSPHRSTKEVTTCTTVRILTHEEFIAKKPHPPKTLPYHEV